MSTEMDVRVARAMGWTLNEAGYPVNFWMGTDGMATGYCDSPWPEDAERYGDAPMLFSGEGVWSPSTDIAAAWQVVEHVCGPAGDDAWTGPRLQLNYEHGAAHAIFDMLEDYGYSVPNSEGRAETVPEAICLAFLAAVEAHND